MKNLPLIIRREYLSTVASKSFIIMTLLIPLLMVAIIAVPGLIAYFNEKGSDTETVAVIDQSGRYGTAIADDDQYHFLTLRADTVGDPREFYNKANGSIAAVVVIPADIDSTARVTIYSEQTINMGLKQRLSSALSDTLTHARLMAYGVPGLDKMLEQATVDVSVKNVKWGKDGEETESSTEIAMILGMILSLLTYMFVLMYGAMIMNGVIEEKTNRIVEVIVSSCRPTELMLGKIIGVALVGLTQLAVWLVMLIVLGIVGGSLFGSAALASADPSQLQAVGDAAQTAATDMPEINGIISALAAVNYTYIICCFVVYFIGGYLLYAALFAAFGSAVDQASEASQFTTPIILIMIIALYAGIACAQTPDGPMAVWCSMIPFTSPIVMMVRLPYDVPLWQLLVSIALLLGTAALIVWVAARIYRTGILLYGKKTSLLDLLRWVRR